MEEKVILFQMPNWRGQSLSYIRRIKGLPAEFPNCLSAIEGTEIHREINASDVPIGSLVWFDNEPYGDVGLYLGGGDMLCVSTPAGVPCIQPVALHGRYRGWSHTIGGKS